MDWAKTKITSADFEQGTINESQTGTWDNLKYPSSNRIRTKSLVPVSKAVNIPVVSGYEYCFAMFDSSQTYLGITTGFYTWDSLPQNIVLPSGVAYIGLLLRANNSATITPAVADSALPGYIWTAGQPGMGTLVNGDGYTKGRNLLVGCRGITIDGSDYYTTVKMEPGKITVTGAGKWDAYKIDPVPEERAREITSSKTDLTFGIDIKATGLATRVPVTFQIRSRDQQNRIVSDTMWIEPEMNGKWHRLSGTVKNVEKRPLALILFGSVTLAAADVGATIEYRKMNLIFGDEPYPWTSAPEEEPNPTEAV